MNTITPASSTIKHLSFEGVDFLEYNGEYWKGCRRCGGAGHYSHNGEHSRCYECDDTMAKLGDHLGTLEQAQRWAHGLSMSRARAAAKREADRLKLVARMEAKQAAVKAAHPDVFEFLMGLETRSAFDAYETEWEYEEARQAGTLPKPETNPFLIAMVENLTYVSQCDRTFTDKMAQGVRKAMDWRRTKAQQQAAHPAPTGRVVVTGEVVSTKVVEGDYGTTYKLTVKADEGFRVYVSMASSLWDDLTSFAAAQGRRLTFTATLQPSGDDVSFAFGSRPAKAAWL